METIINKYSGTTIVFLMLMAATVEYAADLFFSVFGFGG